jgi:hypothetical protein
MDMIITLCCHNEIGVSSIPVNLYGSNKEILQLDKQMTDRLLNWDNHLKRFCEMLWNALPCHLMFLLKEHVVTAIISSLTWNILFEICSSINTK